MRVTDFLRRTAFLALICAASAQGAVITLPPTNPLQVIEIPGEYDVAVVYSFYSFPSGPGSILPEEGGGNVCNTLNKDCSVNGSLAIQKMERFDYATGKADGIEDGPLASATQTFSFDFGAAPFAGGNDDGTWSYSGEGSAVTAWVTKGASAGYTVFYLVHDPKAEGGPVENYSGIPVPTNTPLPFGTFALDGSTLTQRDLSNITFFDSGGGPPQGAPEPGSLLLLSAALAGLGAFKRRRS